MFKIGKTCGGVHSAKRDAETKVDISVYQAAPAFISLQFAKIYIPFKY
jgi:hypothetical protein